MIYAATQPGPLLNILLAIGLLMAGSYSCAHGHHHNGHGDTGHELAAEHDHHDDHQHSDADHGCPHSDGDNAAHNHGDHCPCICHIPASLTNTDLPHVMVRSFDSVADYSYTPATGFKTRIERPPQQA